MPRHWDEGLDYEKTYKRLVNHLRALREDATEKGLVRRFYTMVLLTQLRNGSRVGEAIDMVCHAMRTGERDARVRVEKRSDGETRRMILPDEITRLDLLQTRAVCEERLARGKRWLVSLISTYARRRLGFNTHSLRYAFITHLSRHGYSPQVIAKITGHKRLDFILSYTQEKLADKILENLPGLKTGKRKR